MISEIERSYLDAMSLDQLKAYRLKMTNLSIKTTAPFAKLGLVLGLVLLGAFAGAIADGGLWATIGAIGGGTVGALIYAIGSSEDDLNRIEQINPEWLRELRTFPESDPYREWIEARLNEGKGTTWARARVHLWNWLDKVHTEMLRRG